MANLSLWRTLDGCLALMDEEVRATIRESLARYQSQGVLIFENKDLSSRLIGDKFAIGYGPNNTIKQVPSDGKCQVTPPRGYAWQYYLEAYSTPDTEAPNAEAQS